MTEFNDFNFENYAQEQGTEFGNAQVLPPIQGDTQFFNENESPMDPSAFTQGGDNAVLQETAGMGNEDIFNQNNAFQENTTDTNAIFGETLKTGTEVPDYYGQAFQGTATNINNNVIEGNNLFENTDQIQVQETNIDPNAFFSNENIGTNTNAIFTQDQPIQVTTGEATAFFGQVQENQGTLGENIVIQGTEPTTFLNASPGDFGQIQTQTTDAPDIYGTYKATRTEDLNSFGYGTAETQQVNVQPIPQIETPPVQPLAPPPQTVFPPVVPLIQTQTTTTTTNTAFDQIQNQNLGQIDFEAYPATNAPVHNKAPEPQFDMTNYQQAIDSTPLTSSTTIIQQEEPQFTPQNQQPVIIQQATPPPMPKVIAAPQPIVQATYTPPPIPQIQRRYVARTVQKPTTPITYTQTTNVVTPPPAQVIPQPQVVQVPYQTQTRANPLVQEGKVPGYQYINKLIDEDFKRGRPLYTGTTIHPRKHQINNINQFNQINPTPTYRVGDVLKNKENIGLSKLGAVSSYSKVLTTPLINKLAPAINAPVTTTPAINTPTITTPAITTPNIDIPKINTPNLNIPSINTPQLNVPTINTPNLNIPSINTPQLNVPSINTPTLNTNLGNVVNNNINALNTNIGNNVNNVVGNINSGLDKIGKASSYNVGAQNITPLLNNVGLQPGNVGTDNVRLPQLKDFL